MGCGFTYVSLPQLEMDEVTVEMCMGKAFDVVIRHQLDPLWNQLVHVLYTVGNLRNCFVDQWRVLLSLSSGEYYVPAPTK